MDPHFEIYPEHEGHAPETPTGQHGWRFVAANGAVVAVGGEGFTSEEHASEAIHNFLNLVLGVEPHPPILTAER